MTRQQVLQLVADYAWLNREWEKYPAEVVHDTNYRFVTNMRDWERKIHETENENIELITPLVLAVLDKNISIYESKESVFANPGL
jgi:hypothetical protein